MPDRAGGNPETAKRPTAKYANYFKVGHNAFEFVIDFAQDERAGGGRDPECHTRIITNPASARVLLDLLRRSIEQYDRRHGCSEPV